MPYAIRESGRRFVVVNTETDKVKGVHTSKVKAQRQINLLRAIEHSNWRPTGARARK